MRTGNPLLRLRSHRRESDPSPDADGAATLRGVVQRTALLTGIVALAALAPLQRAVRQPLSADVMVALGAGVVLIYGTIIYSRRAAAPFAASVFALGTGLLIGGISAHLGREAGGLWGLAALGGVTTLVATLWVEGVLLLPSERRVTVFVHLVVGGLFLLLLTAAALQPLIAGIATTSGRPGIAGATCVAVVVLAAFCYVLDVRRVERGLAVGAPASLEWYCAVGLVGTLLWMFPELVRQVTVAHVHVRGAGDDGEDGDGAGPAAGGGE